MLKAISTDNAPKAIGPYSQAIRAGNFLYVSGQLPINPKSGVFISNEIEDQTKQCLANIENIIIAAGFTKRDIVKCTVYMLNLDNFQSMNLAYQLFFGDQKPARVTIEVSRLPKESLIEIDAICHKEKSFS